MNTYTIKEKLLELLQYMKTHSVHESELAIKRIFNEDDILIKQKNTTDSYYNFHSRKFYIYGANGVNIEINTGHGDIYGTEHSHHGKDIYINAPFANNKRFTIFEESKLMFSDDIESTIDSIVNETDLSTNEIIEYFNDYSSDFQIYSLLSDELKNNEKVISALYDRLSLEASLEHDEQVADAAISPYGGEDITIVSRNEILVRKLVKYDLMNNNNIKKLYLMDKENRKYIDEKLSAVNKILYYIEHSKEYRENYEIDKKEIDFKNETALKSYNLEDQLRKIETDIDSLIQEAEKIEIEISQLQKKDYKFLSSFFEKRQDKKMLAELNNSYKELSNKIGLLIDKQNSFLVSEIEIGQLEKNDYDFLSSFVEKRQAKNKNAEFNKLSNNIGLLIDKQNNFLVNEVENIDSKSNSVDFGQRNDLLYTFENPFVEYYDTDAYYYNFENTINQFINDKDDYINQQKYYSQDIYNCFEKNIVIEENGHNENYSCELVTDKYSLYVNDKHNVLVQENGSNTFLDEGKSNKVYTDLLLNIDKGEITPIFNRLRFETNTVSDQTNKNIDIESNSLNRGIQDRSKDAIQNIKDNEKTSKDKNLEKPLADISER